VNATAFSASQQGDIWDPHKDITLAVLGAVLTAGFLLLRTRTRDSRDQTDVSRD
jgi:uncharacterized membrane protein YjdF